MTAIDASARTETDAGISSHDGRQFGIQLQKKIEDRERSQ
jgi:hypothetical protein